MKYTYIYNIWMNVQQANSEQNATRCSLVSGVALRGAGGL